MLAAARPRGRPVMGATSALVPLYASTVTKGEFDPGWRSQPMPQVELAQQQFVRYPFDGDSQVCMHGWLRSKDGLACNSTTSVRA